LKFMLGAFYNLLLLDISWILEVTKKAQRKIDIKKKHRRKEFTDTCIN